MIPDVLTLLLGGLLTGSVYALAATGLMLIHQVLHLVNFAHGSQMMSAMMLAWLLASHFDIDPYASLALTTLLMFGAGYGLQRLVLGPALRHRRGPHTAALLTLGVAAMLEGAASSVFRDGARAVDLQYLATVVRFGPVVSSLPKLVGFGVSAAFALLLWLFLGHTDSGRIIRAVAREPGAARLLGIRPERSLALAYGIGTACLGAAACLLLPTLPVSPQLGPALLLIGLASAAPGLFGGYAGTVAGGLLAGVSEAVARRLLGAEGGMIGVSIVLLARLSVGLARRDPA